MPSQATGRFLPRVRRSSGIHEPARVISLSTGFKGTQTTRISFGIGALTWTTLLSNFSTEAREYRKEIQYVSELERSGITGPRPLRLQIHVRSATFSRFAEFAFLFEKESARRRAPSAL
jgi:hypothetical protein